MSKLKTITYLDTSYSKRFENRINTFGARPLKIEAYKEEFIKTAKDVHLFDYIDKNKFLIVLESYPCVMWNVKILGLVIGSKDSKKAFDCVNKLSSVMLTWLTFITVS